MLTRTKEVKLEKILQVKKENRTKKKSMVVIEMRVERGAKGLLLNDSS